MRSSANSETLPRGHALHRAAHRAAHRTAHRAAHRAAHRSQAAVAIGLQDLRPPFPEDTPWPIRGLIKSCWARRPSSRPKFDGVLNLLAEARSALAQEHLVWLDCPQGHPVYGNPLAGQEQGVEMAPPPPGGQRPAARAPQVMSAIIEPSVQPPPPSEMWKISGT